MNIFGCPIYIGKIKNHLKYKELFQPFIDDDRYFIRHPDWASETLTTCGCTSNEVMPWHDITQEAMDHLFTYLDAFSLRQNVEAHASPWLNKYYKGDYQELHNHTAHHVHFSSAYMLQTADDDINFCFVDKTQDFWPAIGMDRFCERLPQKYFIPEQTEGTIIIFPSNLDHYVKGNKNNTIRATISINFCLSNLSNESSYHF